MESARERRVSTPCRRRKEESIVGVALSRTFGSSFRATGGSVPPTPRPAIDLDISDRLVERYADNVRRTEAERLATFVPIDQRQPVNPCERVAARTVKRELDTVLKKAGNGVVSWEQCTTTDPFQKHLQFLHNHSKTGGFVEQYGADGHFDGEFLYGMRHGKGRHDFKSEVYQGDWKWDKRHGWGTLTLSDGSQVKGEWKAGKPHGIATMVDPLGNVTYEGEFRDGKRHGSGRQIYESGDVYDGSWKDGLQHDRGIYHFSNGDKLYGMWKDGNYHGPAVLHYPDGSISRREYKNGALMSVQDFGHSSQKFGRNLHKDSISRHTADEKFPKEVFMLSSV